MIVGLLLSVGLELLPAKQAFAAFAENSSRIAFVSERDGNRHIYVMNADGSGQTNLSNNSPYDDEPSWAPDGSKIAFTRYDKAQSPRQPWQTYVMNADGTDLTQLNDSAARQTVMPAWSPDGSKIAFVSDRDNPDMIEEIYEIYVMNADGTGQTRLTTLGPDYSAYFEVWKEEGPVWSPDGSKIAFTAIDRNGNEDIFVINADGSGQTRLTDNTATDCRPRWQPTSQSNPVPEFSSAWFLFVASMFIVVVLRRRQRLLSSTRSTMHGVVWLLR